MAKKDKETAGIRVFVYGSLKSGRGNWGALSAAQMIGRCVIEGRYKLLDLGHYPGLICTPSDEQVRKIVGEVYLVDKDTLDTLDMIEGHPDYYCRHKVTTPWKNAWAYFLPIAYDGQRPEVSATEGHQIWRPTDDEVAYVRNIAA